MTTLERDPEHEGLSHPPENKESRGRRYDAAFFVWTVAAFAATRLWHLDYFSLDGDEIFSVNAARLGWAGLLSTVAGDVAHPPLFYALLKIWIGLGGEGLLWMRLFPVLVSFLSVVPFVLLCRELRLAPPRATSRCCWRPSTATSLTTCSTCACTACCFL